jgi:adenylate cyclase
MVQPVSSKLAVHFEEGGEFEKAVSYRYLAGGIALSRHAFNEVKGHTLQGLKMIPYVKDIEAQNIWGIKLRQPLGIALLATEGYSSQSVLDVYSKAYDFCRQSGNSSDNLPILTGLFTYYFEKGDIGKTKEIIAMVSKLGNGQPDGVTMVWLQAMQAVQAWFVGNFQESLQYDEAGLDAYSPSMHFEFVGLTGFDAGLICSGNRAMSLWKLGYPEQAEKQILAALELAQKIASPFMITWALSAVAWVYMYQRNYPAGLEYAKKSVDMAKRDGIDHWLIQSTILYGYLLAKNGKPEEGISIVRDNFLLHENTGAKLYQSMYCYMLADLCMDQGKLVEAEENIAKGIYFINEYGERWWEAELYRLQGDIVLKKETDIFLEGDDDSKAHKCYEMAVTIARKQKAKMFELRASISIARFHMNRSKTNVIASYLINLVDWYSEGFDCEDLIEANKLLRGI